MYRNLLVPILLSDEHQGDAAVALTKELMNDGGCVTLLYVLEGVPDYIRSQLPEATQRTTTTTVSSRPPTGPGCRTTSSAQPRFSWCATQAAQYT